MVLAFSLIFPLSNFYPFDFHDPLQFLFPELDFLLPVQFITFSGKDICLLVHCEVDCKLLYQFDAVC